MTIKFAAGLAIALGATGTAAAEPARYQIDPEHFSVVFSADHIGYGAVWGMFLKGSGSFVFDEAARTVEDLTVEIETGSVFSNSKARDEHLRSAEFLSAKAHPLATFTMTEAAAESETSGKITGDLTLLGETHPVTLDVTLNKAAPYPWGDNYVVGISARTTLPRSNWGMTYALDGNLVGDDVPIIIELEAIRQD
ncbi:YceI family protein [Acuticoccus sp. MNP-M23]|uniref:YceI family protein n=1 Tax=Acuticoccus sp. MNP-M23 TaxID=3072793 RepID=UPI002815288E|nr:YceI family protein [Acuticoccus sp. MNP-M23]WMS43360.1 YceI family protein [Acuticoccus sp. MNP-M23]